MSFSYAKFHSSKLVLTIKSSCFHKFLENKHETRFCLRYLLVNLTLLVKTDVYTLKGMIADVYPWEYCIAPDMYRIV